MCILPLMGHAQVNATEAAPPSGNDPDIEGVEPIDASMMIIKTYDYEVYKEQSKVWEKQTRLRPHDANAWLNYFRHSRYMLMTSPDNSTPWETSVDSILKPIVIDMEKAIPDTYEYYACASYVYTDDIDEIHSPYLEKAMEKTPVNKNLYYYDTWFGRLHLLVDKARYEPFGREYYSSGLYSQEVLKYNLNELDGMAENAIFVGNGDVSVIPKWLIQDGMGKHRDKLVLCYSYLQFPQHCELLFKTLGIGEVPKHEGEFEDYVEYDNYINSIIKTIAERTGRELYFSKHNGYDIEYGWIDNLYDEGLIKHYSTTEIDEMKMKRHNYENVYDLSYLLQPTEGGIWDVNLQLSWNIINSLGDLLAYYKTHDNVRYKELHSLLKKTLERANSTGLMDVDTWNYLYNIIEETTE